ncbi:uncharacterized protein BXZ73DRAFT_83010 [Epithele typhae]|uniref:uncharacterized protein n=1 Tax=Epithele typhae TaxID=378194 RepID=UPI002007D6B8|nr:uncharacterized protein BXZ73DRAFT_83010 [Epithele typhae]KAH9911046.1 hypothetical protein BXZ73DRAFT_83010 [Epithele typhae]
MEFGKALSATWSPDSRRIYVLFTSGDVHVWDARELKYLRALLAPRSAIPNDPSGNVVTTSFATCRQGRHLLSHVTFYRDIPDGTLGYLDYVLVWDITSGGCHVVRRVNLRDPHHHGRSTRQAVLRCSEGDDSFDVLSNTEDEALFLDSGSDGEASGVATTPVRILEELRIAALSSDGRRALCLEKPPSYITHSFCVVDTSTGQPLSEARERTGRHIIYCVQGRGLLLGGHDASKPPHRSYWNTEDGTLFFLPPIQKMDPFTFAATSDGSVFGWTAYGGPVVFERAALERIPAEKD